MAVLNRFNCLTSYQRIVARNQPQPICYALVFCTLFHHFDLGFFVCLLPSRIKPIKSHVRKLIKWISFILCTQNLQQIIVRFCGVKNLWSFLCRLTVFPGAKTAILVLKLKWISICLLFEHLEVLSFIPVRLFTQPSRRIFSNLTKYTQFGSPNTKTKYSYYMFEFKCGCALAIWKPRMAFVMERCVSSHLVTGFTCPPKHRL